MIRKALMACLVGLMVMPAIGQAQSNKEKAKQLFIQGRAAYKDGQYNKALQSFVKVNQLKAHPLMLTNIAKVYEAMENLPKAIEFNENMQRLTRRTSHRSERRLRGYRQPRIWPSLNLATNPAGASVQVGNADGPIQGITPMTLRLAPKRHTIVLKKSGYKIKTLPILFQAGTHRSMRVTLTADMPTIEVVSTPPGAQVTIDGRMVGQTPFRGMVSIGPHTVVIQQPNQPPVQRQVTMTAQHSASAPMRVTATTIVPLSSGYHPIQEFGSRPACCARRVYSRIRCAERIRD